MWQVIVWEFAQAFALGRHSAGLGCPRWSRPFQCAWSGYLWNQWHRECSRYGWDYHLHRWLLFVGRSQYGLGVLLDSTSGSPLTTYPKVNGNINAVASDGAGG